MCKNVKWLWLLGAAALLWPVAARGAGDASAIRRATRTEDSRYVSNYRPDLKQTSHRGRTSGYRSSGYYSSAVGCRGRR